MSERMPRNRELPMLVVVALFASLVLAGCASTTKRDQPIPPGNAGVIASAEDSRIAVGLDAVIVRNGPGSWAENATWDEYVLSVRTTSGEPVEITGVALVDALGSGVAPRTSRSELTAASEARARKYQDSGITVDQGVGASTLFAAGGATLAGSAAVGVGALAVGTSVAATTTAATAAAAGAVVVAPALVVAGAATAVQEHKVDHEIKQRATSMPLSLAGDSPNAQLKVFFPLAPAPQRMLINYRDTHGQHTLVVDTRAALAGLHLPTQTSLSLPAKSP